MKQLIVIIGPNAVGKSTTAKCMVEKIPQTAYVDSDWCRCMNPFLLTDITKEIVKENIYYLLHNYLTCVEIETVIFTYSWHGGRKEIYDRVIEQFRNDGIEFVENIIILKCSEEENVRRALEDKRDEERVERGKKTFSFYDDFDYPCIDTTEMSVTEVLNKRDGRKASDSEDLKSQLANELVDVIHYAFAIASLNEIDLNDVILEKDKKASIKYNHERNLEQFSFPSCSFFSRKRYTGSS